MTPLAEEKEEMANDYAPFIQQVKKATGIDLSLYKEAQMKRRLTSLRDKNGFTDFQRYYDAMRKDESLFAQFLDRMTINVSEFFRNQKRWEIMENKILPELMEGDKKLKVWSAACSTGEEPYTLSMILTNLSSSRHSQIIATDIDEIALNRAKAGIYPERSLQEVPESYKKAYFQKDGLYFKVDESIKKQVSFQKHNLLADPFDRQYDLIVCRNVLIYFTEEAKHELYKKFSEALRPGGYLFVGSTEQIFNPAQYGFTSEETFFYKRK